MPGLAIHDAWMLDTAHAIDILPKLPYPAMVYPLLAKSYPGYFAGREGMKTLLQN